MRVKLEQLLLDRQAGGRRRRRRDVVVEPHLRKVPGQRAQLKLKVVVDGAQVVEEGEEARNNLLVQRQRVEQHVAGADVFAPVEIARRLDAARRRAHDAPERRVVVGERLAKGVGEGAFERAHALKAAVEERIVPLEVVVVFANVEHPLVVAALPLGLRALALELNRLLVGGGEAAAAVLEAVFRIDDVFQRGDALVGRELDLAGARRKKVEKPGEHALKAVDDGVANLLGGLLHVVANLAEDLVGDRADRVAVGAQQLLVGVGVLLGLFAPLGGEDLDELADANARADHHILVVLELVVGGAHAL